MKYIVIFLVFLSRFILSAQVHDNGIGGYGYVQHNIMHHERISGNWTYGGGGLIVNKVYFAGLYYGSQANSFENIVFNDGVGSLLIAGKDTSQSWFSLTFSDIGGEIGGVFFAEKPLQLIVSSKVGALISSYKNNINGINRDIDDEFHNTTKLFLNFSPELKLALMPTRFLKIQVGMGLRFCLYNDDRLSNSGPIGSRDAMLNSWYTALGLSFGSF
ncbi:MAG: hypothetical protein MUE53_01535 [Chitinophagales bacterium]|jgi:hypothetical protein|nr:hypothetical protein [Chitinophagales bacterium]